MGLQRAEARNSPVSCLWLVLVGLAFALPHCTAEEPKGRLEIKIKDHREAIEDFASLEVTVEEIRLNAAAEAEPADPRWELLSPQRSKVDLTQFAGADAATIFRGQLRADRFDAIDLRLREIQGLLKGTRQPAEVKNFVAPIRLRFSVAPGKTTAVVLDLVVIDMADHPGRGYELRIKGYELYADGMLLDRVPPASS